MNTKYYLYSGGRVGGIRPPYRDHLVCKIILVACGLDMSREKHAGLLDYQTFFYLFSFILYPSSLILSSLSL